MEAINFEATEAHRYKGKKRTSREIVDFRLLRLGPALSSEVSIIRSADPMGELARLAADCTPKVHPHRLQLWFFSYLLHGRNRWSLKAPTHNIGTWSRYTTVHVDKKFGRKSLASNWCFNSPPASIENQIVESFISRAGLGVTLTDMYSDAMIEDFGCSVLKNPSGSRFFTHPENRPFPSPAQFRRIVVKHIGLEKMHKTIYGQVRTRNRMKVFEGTFLYQSAYLLEKVEVDAYFVNERPTGLVHFGPGDVLACARAICCVSGAVVGIGFSFGGETKDAYRAMLFAMCVDKEYVAKLYGIDPKHLHDWKAKGLCIEHRSDRGPGGWNDLSNDLSVQTPVKSICPSNSAQSKAFVEGSNPESTSHDEAADYVQSQASIAGLMRREILRAAGDNRSKNIGNRLKDADIAHFDSTGSALSPNELWDYLGSRGRSAGYNIGLHEAVRAFWTPVVLDVDQAGVWYRHRPFVLPGADLAPLIKGLVQNGRTKINAFVLPAVVRYIWAEINGELIELEATHRVRGDEEDLFVPLSFIDQSYEKLAGLNANTRQNKLAVQAELRAQFKADNGSGWSSGTRKSGSPKRGAGLARAEGNAIKKHST